jgi:hypothetical protein
LVEFEEKGGRMLDCLKERKRIGKRKSVKRLRKNALAINKRLVSKPKRNGKQAENRRDDIRIHGTTPSWAVYGHDAAKVLSVPGAWQCLMSDSVPPATLA